MCRTKYFEFQLGPEKGVTHLAVSAIVNGLWDLWGRLEKKPVWKLLVDMTPEVRMSKQILFILLTLMINLHFSSAPLLNDLNSIFSC